MKIYDKIASSYQIPVVELDSQSLGASISQ